MGGIGGDKLLQLYKLTNHQLENNDRQTESERAL